jgi:ubiquinone/menaquinone biosynthesis C-methylase UbiE
MRSSISLFNTLAAGYDAHFEALHRRAYDDLAWEFVQPLLPAVPGCVIDAGCGVGRWAERLVALGHHIVGIEQAPAMADVARARLPTDRFELIEGSMEAVELPEGQADLVLALGSLQYTVDPEHMIERFARWTRVGGSVVVLVDSLVALVLELVAAGKTDARDSPECVPAVFSWEQARLGVNS